MALSFLMDLLSVLRGSQIIPALAHTPFDELMIIDLKTGQYESRYHADGKFFAPVNGGDFRSLLDYSSAVLFFPFPRPARAKAMGRPAGGQGRLHPRRHRPQGYPALGPVRRRLRADQGLRHRRERRK